jgi:hypothetical protein
MPQRKASWFHGEIRDLLMVRIERDADLGSGVGMAGGIHPPLHGRHGSLAQDWIASQ